ncbi:MAG: helix-turn-helix transcriptional regulator [Sphaerochaetaceae bacterium]|nr:helix-turn-helix transcriptional regulator [Sphaerochaetaceae bacterium]
MDTENKLKEESSRILSRNIKTFREKAGYSQAQLAEKIDASTNHIYQLESGVRFPSASMLDKLVKALNVEVYELFFDYDKLVPVTERTKIVKQLCETFDALLSQCIENTLPKIS